MTPEATGKDSQRESAPTTPSRADTLWRLKYLIIGASLLIAAAAYFVGSTLPERYESKATLQVSAAKNGSPTQQSVLAVNELARQYAQLVTADPILRPAARAAGESDGALAGSITAGTLNDTNLIQIAAQADTASKASRRAKAVAEEFSAYVSDVSNRGVQAYSDRVAVQLKPLDDEIARLRASIARRGGRATTAAVSSEQQALSNLIAQRAATEASLATSAADAAVVARVVTAASGSVKTQPQPKIYAVAAFILALLLISQLAAWWVASRTPDTKL